MNEKTFKKALKKAGFRKVKDIEIERGVSTFSVWWTLVVCRAKLGSTHAKIERRSSHSVSRGYREEWTIVSLDTKLPEDKARGRGDSLLRAMAKFLNDLEDMRETR